MQKHMRILLLLSLLVLSQAIIPHQARTQTPNQLKIGIDLGHGNLHATGSELANFTALLTANAAQVLYSKGALNQTYLNSINLLIISSPQTSYSPSEISTLTTWFRTHGNLWLSASYENSSSMLILNSILNATGSHLGFEYGYASDPLYNLNSTGIDSDQVILPLINQKYGLPIGVTTGVRTVYAYRPVPIIAYNGTGFTEFNSTLQTTAFWIAQTSSRATVTKSSTQPLLVYGVNRSITIPTIGIETTAAGRLAATGSPIFSQWMGMFSYRQNQPYDDRVAVKNLLAWLSGPTVSGELEASIPELRGQGQPLVLIYTGSDSQYAKPSLVQPLITILTGMGINAQTFPILGFAAIQNASAIIMMTPHQLITSNESAAIDLWMREGNKLLILASTADYQVIGSATESESLNNVLSTLHSSLRFEYGSVIDPEVNLEGNPYLTLASNINHLSPTASSFTANVRSLYMQFGTILTGSNQTTFFPLENQTYLNSLTNVTWLARTSNTSRIFNLLGLPSPPLQAHSQYEKGSYIDAALESYRQDKYHGSLLLLGGPIFADFSRLLEYPSVYGYPTDNLIFIRNIFSRLLTQTQTRTEITITAYPSQLSEGGNVTLNLQYKALQTSTSNLSEVDRVPITPANISLTLSGTSLQTKLLANHTYTATSAPTGTGSISWSATASAGKYQPQTSSGTVQVNPLPTRFTYYVLGIPIVIFIAVTIAVLAKKTR